MNGKFWKKIMLKRRLRKMDKWWYFCGGCCFGLIPPSVYETHTKEEAERFREEKLKELRDIINEFELRHEKEGMI